MERTLKQGVSKKSNTDISPAFPVATRAFQQIIRPAYTAIGILQTMWIWNYLLLPRLSLGRSRLTTISLLASTMKGSLGASHLGVIFASLTMAVFPIVLLHLSSRKYIIESLAAGNIKT